MFRYLITIIFTSLVLTGCSREKEPELVIFHPVVDESIFSNPGMGWQSADRVVSPEDPYPSSIAFRKYYWQEFQSGPGTYDFRFFEEDLEEAKKAGQRLHFRIMIVDERTSGPGWLKEIGVPGFEYVYDDGDPESSPGTTIWTPDFQNKKFQDIHFEFLQKLGEWFDNDPGVAYLDIGSVGLWGEWHFSNVKPKLPPIDQNTAKVFIDQYFKAFPKTLKLMQIEHATGLRYAAEMGAGWRADCFGNMRYHMTTLYPLNIQTAKTQLTWRKAPVAFETCWDIARWVKEGWNVEKILQRGLDYHASLFHNKNAPIPDQVKPAVENFLKKLGYRFVLKEGKHAQSVPAGEQLPLLLLWENRGVAPAYSNHQLYISLENDTHETEHVSEYQIKKWLPGEFRLAVRIPVPKHLPEGDYKLKIGLFDPRSSQSPVRIAISGPSKDGWHTISKVTIKKAK